MIVGIEYALPSALESTREVARLSLAPEVRRPLRFVGKLRRDVLSVRAALQALGQVIWSDDTWLDDETFAMQVLDPVVTVHPDRLTFEAFSADMSAYGLVIVPRDHFEAEGDVVCGTTNVDFTAWLGAALGELRSRRETWLRIEPAGVEVRTVGRGGRYEPKVDIPDRWVRAFLSLQAAMATPGTRLHVRPVDLLAAIRFLSVTKAKLSPRGLRYELVPDQDARLVLEPWEHTVRLKGAAHTYPEPRTLRVWGRRRLRLLEPLLPYADRARVYLKGRAMPHAYAVDLGGVTFVLALTGYSAATFSDGGYRLLAADRAPEDTVQAALGVLQERVAVGLDELAGALGVDRAMASRAAARLCRRGRAIWDLERREVRHRELFAEPVDEARLYPPDPREEEAERLKGQAEITAVTPRETRKLRRLKTPDGRVEREVVYHDLILAGSVAGYAVEIVLSDEDRLIFGRCGCPWFAEHLLHRGPCAHMLAVWRAGEAYRRDGPTSLEPSAPPEADEEEGPW